MTFVQFSTFDTGAPLYLRADAVLMLTTCHDAKGLPMVGAVGVVSAAGPSIVRGSVESVARALGARLQKAPDPANGTHTLKLPGGGT